MNQNKQASGQDRYTNTTSVAEVSSSDEKKRLEREQRGRGKGGKKVEEQEGNESRRRWSKQILDQKKNTDP